jgi:hypothetical protein
MRILIIALSLFITTSARSQEVIKPLKKYFIVKTNVFSLLACRPTITVEKVFTSRFSTEASFVWGEFNNVLLTDHYNYNGFLLRAKHHFSPIELGRASFYGAAYIGTLKRTIFTHGQSDRSGWIGYTDRYFSAQSIRGGGTLGITQFKQNKWVIDFQTSMGYGRYLNIDKQDPNTYANGYLDMQLWFSIGYCF